MVNMGLTGSGLLGCLTRPEALRAEAQMLHTMADWLDPLEEDQPHRGEGLSHAAPNPLGAPLAPSECTQDPGLREARVWEHPHEADVAPGVRSTMLQEPSLAVHRPADLHEVSHLHHIEIRSVWPRHL